MSGDDFDADDGGYDPIDEANARAENFREGLLRSGKWRRPVAPLATGECLYCTYPVAPGRRWCGPDCRDAWQDEKRRNKLNGHDE